MYLEKDSNSLKDNGKYIQMYKTLIDMLIKTGEYHTKTASTRETVSRLLDKNNIEHEVCYDKHISSFYVSDETVEALKLHNETKHIFAESK